MWFVVDVESDGPIPLKYSMVSFGAVRINEALDATFYGKTKPISDLWVPDALAVSGHTGEEHQDFDDPKQIMERFATWINEVNKGGRPIFASDNPAFDWQWINYYFPHYLGSNPFGFSGRRIGDLYAGMQRDTFARWKHLRKTAHTHNPVDDARGNAEGLLEMKAQGLKLPT